MATNRTIGALASSYSISRALPAESSRQALLRAISTQRAAQTRNTERSLRRNLHSASTYATAAALAEEDDTSHQMEQSFERRAPAWVRQRIDRHYRPTASYAAALDPPRKAPLPQSSVIVKDLEVEGLSGVELQVELETPELRTRIPYMKPVDLETFHRMAYSTPVEAFLSLPTLSTSDRATLTLECLTGLLKTIRKLLRVSSLPPEKIIDPRDASVVLEMIRILLYDLPPRSRSSSELDDRANGNEFSASESGSSVSCEGQLLSGEVLEGFLRTSLVLGCDNLLKDVFRERLRVQTELEVDVLHTSQLAKDLIYKRKWSLFDELFRPPRYPAQRLTSNRLSDLLLANLACKRAILVPKLFLLHSTLDLAPTPDAYNHLTQAYLQLGDIGSARKIVEEAKVKGNVSLADQQIAILRGYRHLGIDLQKEVSVLDLVNQIGVKPQAALLHALIKAKLKVKDMESVRQLLSQFDLSILGETELAPHPGLRGALSPTADTICLAFKYLSASFSYDGLRSCWHSINQQPKFVTDKLIAQLVKSLASLGRLKEIVADAHIATSLYTKRDCKLQWVPPGMRLGIETFNSIMAEATRQMGLQGLSRAIGIFKKSDVPANNETLEIILKFAQDSLINKPLELAQLLNSLLDLNPALRATGEQLDILTQMAIRAAAREYHVTRQKELGVLEKTADGNTTDAQAGLRATHPFRKAIAKIVQSLQDQGVRSSPSSLASRLRFDALTRSMTTSGIPSARLVWNDMVTRGFQPDKRHFISLLQGYTESYQMAEAEELLVLARQTGIEPTRGMWLSLLVAYGKEGSRDVDKAVKAYQAIENTLGQGLDVRSTSAMIRVFTQAKMFGKAQELSAVFVSGLLTKGSLIYVPPAMATSDLAKAATHPATSVSGSDPGSESTSDAEHSAPAPEAVVPRNMLLNETAIAIAAEAFRQSQPRTALTVILAYLATTPSPALLGNRIRDVVKSIRSQLRAKAQHGVVLDENEAETLAQAGDMLQADWAIRQESFKDPSRPRSSKAARKTIAKIVERGLKPKPLGP